MVWVPFGEALALGTPPTATARLGATPLGVSSVGEASQQRGGGYQAKSRWRRGKTTCGEGLLGPIGEAGLNVRRKEPKPRLSPMWDLSRVG
jgi:hypothetical protein